MDEEFQQRNRMYKENHMDIIELQSIISKIKKSDRLNSILNRIEEKINEHDYRLIKLKLKKRNF